MAQDYMKAISEATHVYVGLAQCGCWCAVVTDVDHPIGREETAKDVADMVRLRYEVRRIPIEEWKHATFTSINKCQHKDGGAGMNRPGNPAILLQPQKFEACEPKGACSEHVLCSRCNLCVGHCLCPPEELRAKPEDIVKLKARQIRAERRREKQR